ncbi:hypothetical protein CRYUN_Cryun12cG0041400 [Craigia yunnanensis]
MFICQAVMTIAIASKFGTSGNPGQLPLWFSTLVVVAIEIFPLEIRSAAQSINVSVNMIFTFAVAQAFTAMLCHLKFGLFIFFACCVVGMSIVIYKLFPETKGEEMTIVWKNHPYWSKFVNDEDPHYEMTKN